MGLSEEFKKTKKTLVLPSTYTVIDAYFKGLDDQQQKDISEFVKDLEELIAWSNNYPKDSEIYIRFKRKREKWEGLKQ